MRRKEEEGCGYHLHQAKMKNVDNGVFNNLPAYKLKITNGLKLLAL